MTIKSEYPLPRYASGQKSVTEGQKGFGNLSAGDNYINYLNLIHVCIDIGIYCSTDHMFISK